MWQRLGRFILTYRLPLLLLLAALTGFMVYHASKVELSYDFSKAIPVNNPKYKTYQEFRKKFGEDGNLLVIGIQTDKLFEANIFNSYAELQRKLKKLYGVDDVIGVPSAVNLVKVPETEKLKADTIFAERTLTQAEIDSASAIFLNLPFYRQLLYNPSTNAWLMGVRINKDLMASKKRMNIVSQINELADEFGKQSNLTIYKSGLPHIRTVLSGRIVKEMRMFIIASILLSALILLLFFRSLSAMLLSLSVVVLGVIWSFATIEMMGYKISILNALIPPLIVVIGIPNCIYFLNKFHTAWNETGDKRKSLVMMIDKMGIVTLFCNLAAAIGFAVFALTQSQILREFGIVAGINIVVLFFISLILIPAVLSYLPSPKNRHTKYLNNPGLNRWLDRLERWSLNHRKLIYGITIAIVAVSIVGATRLKALGFIVDDIPKEDKIYTDLRFFENNFKGVMPLEIVIDTKKKYGVSRNLNNLERIDSLSQFLTKMPGIAKPLSIVEGLKFAKQAFFDGDSNSYTMPSSYDLPALSQYLNFKGDSVNEKNSFAKIVSTFMDSAKQEARISVSMADVGSSRLPFILDSIQLRAEYLFNGDSIKALTADAQTRLANKDDSLWGKRKYNIELTGTSVTFLEGSRYILNGLKDSIAWAFLFIALCMLYLFRSVRILFCSLIPNIIPLLITAGIMGWVGVPLKPSTVLVFSVALGIAIDITIRFLVNYKQELPHNNYDMKQTVIETIHSTGISIIYTSLVLIAGFIIFCFSGFDGTKALGWLTSLTLVTATFTNLVLLPAILISFVKIKK
ncbi:MAG: MMPL family transporter [Chitinophagaceae bacterium]|nr:MMPL family transporter [Chitinophagaceae bacterium]MBK8300191.1 MMPL family transporter [Chitinophagaceae bacterium]MBK9658643.1 MMPL family transporter [Chitinophagaceae bacterium]MBP6234474.1 MMPL family transporter [Chitinophagaceae bacterium]HQW42952.1 MMPL family transporter [Chitinophagaceae bacterium]